MIKLSITDKVTPRLRELATKLQGASGTEASHAMAVEAQLTIVEHLRLLAETRHDTANKLGASPTGFLAQATDVAAAADVISADSDSATLSMRHPAIARAYRDIQIKPKNAKALAIPINAIAYGRYAREFQDQGLFRLGGRGADVGKNILAMKSGDTVIPLFLLVRSVTQKRDPSLMPSNEQIAAAGARGLGRFVKHALQKARNASSSSSAT